ncbi:GNAT family N-acetyltransferase [Pseudoalteromonas sp. Of7M-16]|uniref:GNAT family N-acetyltransferase n=1 Tax=Pseudoalteromonas sp. Of7M-16 TaxID=2917756 RepID=UPI001EF411E1|nr:GNAT family N-acetyltransferase [Pseudoalteromonas sp. Of7M-16]MCG7549274.1 GNAT family N-acetyltransferase [Pseudoalteromonas sp. Of7M-16]
MITITKLSEKHLEQVKAIQIEDNQVEFAGIASEFLNDICDTTHLHVIEHQDKVIGYFKLDLAYAQKYDFCPKDAVGIRAFVIDKRQQGKGYGKKAVHALFPYVSDFYPEYRQIYLTVNCRNNLAYQCYKKAGFEDTNEKYLGSPAGPNYIMKGMC